MQHLAAEGFPHEPTTQTDKCDSYRADGGDTSSAGKFKTNRRFNWTAGLWMAFRVRVGVGPGLWGLKLNTVREEKHLYNDAVFQLQLKAKKGFCLLFISFNKRVISVCNADLF